MIIEAHENKYMDNSPLKLMILKTNFLSWICRGIPAGPDSSCHNLEGPKPDLQQVWKVAGNPINTELAVVGNLSDSYSP